MTENKNMLKIILTNPLIEKLSGNIDDMDINDLINIFKDKDIMKVLQYAASHDKPSKELSNDE